MNDGATQTTLVRSLRLLVALEATFFFAGALLHTGVELGAGPAVLTFDRIFPATVVEGVGGIALAVSAYALFVRRPWAWTATVAAQVLSLAGVILGASRTAAGAGPHNLPNDIFHYSLLIITPLTLLVLFSARDAVGGERRFGPAARSRGMQRS